MCYLCPQANTPRAKKADKIISAALRIWRKKHGVDYDPAHLHWLKRPARPKPDKRPSPYTPLPSGRQYDDWPGSGGPYACKQSCQNIGCIRSGGLCRHTCFHSACETETSTS